MNVRDRQGAISIVFSNFMLSKLPLIIPFCTFPVVFCTVVCTVTEAISVRGNGRSDVINGSFINT